MEIEQKNNQEFTLLNNENEIAKFIIEPYAKTQIKKDINSAIEKLFNKNIPSNKMEQFTKKDKFAININKNYATVVLTFMQGFIRDIENWEAYKKHKNIEDDIEDITDNYEKFIGFSQRYNLVSSLVIAYYDLFNFPNYYKFENVPVKIFKKLTDKDGGIFNELDANLFNLLYTKLTNIVIYYIYSHVNSVSDESEKTIKRVKTFNLTEVFKIMNMLFMKNKNIDKLLYDYNILIEC